VTILVNDAGMPDAQYATKMSPEFVDEVIATNVRAPWLLSCEVARRLIALKEAGRIVNISSMGAFLYAGNGAALYAVTKAAVNRMTEVLAVEWAKFHINVNAIAPGAFESEMMAGMIDRQGDVRRYFPRKRLGEPAQLDSTLLSRVAGVRVRHRHHRQGGRRPAVALTGSLGSHPKMPTCGGPPAGVPGRFGCCVQIFVMGLRPRIGADQIALSGLAATLSVPRMRLSQPDRVQPARTEVEARLRGGWRGTAGARSRSNRGRRDPFCRTGVRGCRWGIVDPSGTFQGVFPRRRKDPCQPSPGSLSPGADSDLRTIASGPVSAVSSAHHRSLGAGGHLRAPTDTARR
jgi:hypothetical protein